MVVSSQSYCISFQYFIFWTPTSRSVGTRVMYIEGYDDFTFLHLLLLYSIEAGVETGGCICVLLYVFEEFGRAGRFGL